MDDFDRRILTELAADARMSATELAERVHLSVSATAERLRRLRAGGAIDRFTLHVDPVSVGRPLDVLVDVRLGNDVDTHEAESALRSTPSVINAIHLTGSFDLQLRVAARDVAELNDLLTMLKDELGCYETNTRLVLEVVEGFPRLVSLT